MATMRAAQTRHGRNNDDISVVADMEPRASTSPALAAPQFPRDDEAATPTASERAFGGPRVIAGCDGVEHRVDDLSYLGPLGPYGPLGTLGPIGDNAWNPSRIISGSDWSQFSRTATEAGGPLSAAGPLGPSGPVARADEAPASLRPGGDRAVLGPLGPLGALGPLGPLGPIGATGLERDSDGDFTRDGRVVRSVEAAGQRHDLVESYAESRAKPMRDNDTSFMVHGAIDRGEADSYAFTAHRSEYVTISLVPEKHADNFDLEIFDGSGAQLASCAASASVDWVQLAVPANTNLRAVVRLRNSFDPLTPTYRLVVTGAADHRRE